MSQTSGEFSPRLKDFCRRLGRAENLRSGMEAVAWACDGILPFYRVAVALPAVQPDHLYVAAAWARRAEEELEGYDFSLRGHPAERTIREGVVVVRTDPAGDRSDPRLARLYLDEGKVEELVVPLDLGGRRGLLVFASREKGGFGEAACTFAENVARLFALWVRPWAGPEAPQTLKDQYEALLDGALDGIAVLGDERILYANASFHEIFGIPAGRPVAGSFADLLTRRSRAVFADAVDWVGTQSRVLPRIEVEAPGPRGSQLHLDIGLQQVVYQGEPAVLLQVHNATERAERELYVRDAHARMDALIQTLAHDIRGPLTTIVGFSELLAERGTVLGADKLADMVAVIHRSSRSLKDLVEGLLEYAGLGASEAPTVDVQVEDLLAAVERELEGAIRQSGARIEYRRIPRTVRGRPVELGRVFKNLVENSLKYRRPDIPPLVRCSCVGEEGGFYVFCVEDNGLGIEAEHLPEVCELFKRGEGGGAGVGLAIVSRVVSDHGGRHWVESRPGEGSSFYFTLPRPGEEDLPPRVG